MKSQVLAGAIALALSVTACGDNHPARSDNNAAEAAGSAAAQTYSAAGHITAIDGNQVTISHGPVQELHWSAMTMTFRADDPAMLRGIGVGDRVNFQFRHHANAYILIALNKAG